VTRAAAELHLAQPTVSLQLKKLAEALEVQLFEQRGRNLHLTGAGRALREECEALIQCVLRADARLEAWRQPKQEVLRLAAEPGSRAAAARLLADFCSRHPGVQGSLHVGDSLELLERLGAGTDDVYLFTLEIDGVPEARRWSLQHPRGRPPGPAAALFLREALQLDAGSGGANNPSAIEEEGPWSSRGPTTRQ
jgi:DNA-binding transcriptional LysR family regulator